MKFLPVLIFLFACATGSRILGIFPLPGNSHYNLARALMRALAERGHDVTVISHFGEKNPPQNGTYRDIIFPDFNPSDVEARKKWNMFSREGSNPFVDVFRTAMMAQKFIPRLLSEKKVQDLLTSDKEKFDVVILDEFLNDAFKAVSTHFNAPLISLNPVYPNFWINNLVGNPSPSAYIPNILSPYSHPMTFCERVSNSLLQVVVELLYKLYVYPKHAEFARKHIPSHPNLYDSLYNISLVLQNSHPTLNQAVPQVPNMVEVGGFHVEPPKKLPEDLQKFFDTAEHGVIYFSMGSNLQGVQFPEQQRQAILKAFSKLKQKVLWKWEDDDLPGKPDNVKLTKWAPQQDILAQPNLKLFITHGGFVSSVETAAYGVPVLVIPIFGDQSINGKFAYKTGFGRYIKLKAITEETFMDNINELINNSRYKETAVKRSKVFHDRIVSPMDTAIYWVEYVIRHRGAPHLKVAGIDLPWYKYYLVDVIALVLLILFSCLVGSCCVIKIIYRKLTKSKVKKLKKN